MRKISLLALMLSLGLALNAQKLKTRSGYVKFFSDAAVEDISAENKQVSSIINLENGEFAFLAPIKAFEFEKALMQEHFNENYMESGKFPKAIFKGKIKGYEQIDLSKDGSYTLVFTGVMTIHGVEQKIEQKVMMTVKDGKASAEAEFMLKCSDYEVEIPSAKADNISNELKITVKFDYA
ncbi:MAG: YceI family protein [Bacteroidetes bacterium]|nr:YceI family protein [Bacteroidota bacterium]